MLAPVSSSRRDNKTSFTKLADYLTKERDPETGEELVRGEIVLSDNLMMLETAAMEMEGIASHNARNEDPIYHYQIAWQPGERPTREQWEQAARQTLEDLGYSEHQFLIAAHDDKEHFHVHVMVNKIHPETARAHTPRRDMFTLDERLRHLEHEQGWAESHGLFRWDALTKTAVKNTREEMEANRDLNDRSRGKAGEFASFQDADSLQQYVKKKAALDVTALLARKNVKWSDLHRTLARHGLELHKGDQGGYTVGSIGTDLRCKASDVFRRSFAGKLNREATEAKLGPWVPATEADRQPAAKGEKYQERKDATDKRKAQREARELDRKKLKMCFGAYRDARRTAQKLVTTVGQQKRTFLSQKLKTKKATIRAQNIPWQEKRAELSRAVAESVIEARQLKVELLRTRLEENPLTYQEWVTREALAGDVAAAAQMRGWRYNDQRNVAKSDRVLQSQKDAAHLSAGSASDSSDIAELMHARLEDIRRNEALTATLKASEWTINRRTGDVHYTVAGALAIVDRGKTVSVLNSDEAAIVMGLEMAVKKYGSVIKVEGSQAWKDRVAKAAAKHGVFVKFVDPSMQRTFLVEQMREDRYGVMSKQLADLHTRVLNAPQKSFQLSSPEAAEVFFAGVAGVAAGRPYVTRILDDLKANKSRATLTVKGLATVEARLSSTTNHPVFTVVPMPDKGVQLANALQVGSFQMAELSKAQRAAPQRPGVERTRKGRGDER